VPLEATQPVCESAVLTQADTSDLATQAFVNALSRASRRRQPVSMPVPTVVPTAVPVSIASVPLVAA
jgi:hypothetical protein